MMIYTYRNQSTAKIRLMSSAGSPTEVRTITMVTNPALGIDAAPILAHVAVTLKPLQAFKMLLWKTTIIDNKPTDGQKSKN